MFRFGVTARGCGGALGALLTLGCNYADATQRGLEREWRSEHFIYRTSADDNTVCEAELLRLEQHYEALHAALGIEPGSEPIVYSKFPSTEAFERDAPCSPLASACFFRHAGIFSSQAFERHELVHGYMAPLGDAHKLLEEGLAEALSCGSKLHLSSLEIDWRDAFSSAHWARANAGELRRLYTVSSWWVAYLLRTAGGKKLVQFWTQLSPGSESQEAESVFREIYAAELSDVWLLAMSEVKPEKACVYAFECSGPALSVSSWIERSTSYERSATCGSAPAFTTLNITEPTWVRDEPVPALGAEAQSASAVQSVAVSSCDGAGSASHLASLPPSSVRGRGAFYYSLPVGRYFIAAGQAQRGRRFSPEPDAAVLAASCSGVEAWQATDERALTFAVGLAGWQQTSTGEEPAALWTGWQDLSSEVTRWRIECGPGLSVRVCAGCELSTCQLLCDSNVAVASFESLPSPRFQLTLDTAQAAWFRLQALP